MNFAVVDDEIYIRTSAAGSLSTLADGQDDVAFGVDHFDAVTGHGWNVTVRGEARRVDEPDVVTMAEASGTRHTLGRRRSPSGRQDRHS